MSAAPPLCNRRNRVGKHHRFQIAGRTALVFSTVAAGKSIFITALTGRGFIGRHTFGGKHHVPTRIEFTSRPRTH